MGLGDNELKGRDGQGTVQEEGMKALAGSVNPLYESKEFVVGAGEYDVKANVSGAFSEVPIGHNFTIRTDADITVRFNTNSKDAITVLAAEGVFSWNHTEFINVFINGENANVKMLWS